MFRSARVMAVAMTEGNEKLDARSPSAPSKLLKIPPKEFSRPEKVKTSQSKSAPTMIPIAAASETKKPALVAERMSMPLSLSLICLRGSDDVAAVRLNKLANLGSFTRL